MIKQRSEEGAKFAFCVILGTISRTMRIQKQTWASLRGDLASSGGIKCAFDYINAEMKFSVLSCLVEQPFCMSLFVSSSRHQVALSVACDDTSKLTHCMHCLHTIHQQDGAAACFREETAAVNCKLFYPEIDYTKNQGRRCTCTCCSWSSTLNSNARRSTEPF